MSHSGPLPETARTLSHLPGALPAPSVLPTAAFRHGQCWGTGPAAQHPAVGQQEHPSGRGCAGTSCGAPAVSARLAHTCLVPVSASTPHCCQQTQPSPTRPQPLTGAGADVRHVNEGPCVLDQSRVMQRDARAKALGVHGLTELCVSHWDRGFVIPCGKKLDLRSLSLARTLL